MPTSASGRVIRRIAVAGLAALFGLGGLLQLGCPPPGPAQSHPEALIVYNANAGPDAADIAAHYAGKRGIPTDRLCPVELPTGQFATADHLLAARRTIVESCVCGLIPPGSRPSPCSLANLDAVRLASPITHLAIVRGMPPRLTGTPWPSDFEEPSFDFYLAYSLYRTQDLFAPGSNGVPASSYLTANLVSQGSEGMILSAPPLSTALHRDVAYGRIEAIDAPRTLALIDRTLDAERNGVVGNFFEEKNNRDFRFLRDTTGSHAPECTAYVTSPPVFYPNQPGSIWPAGSCRAATTWTAATGPDGSASADDPIRGAVPGTWMSTVPYALDASLLLGSSPTPNAQAGFNTFENLTRWRTGGAGCTALCADLPTQSERDACAAASIDWFRELNVGCVGVSRGFVGHQVRSWPVQYYGFFPAGWANEPDGSVEKTPPRVLAGGGFQSADFADDRYLHFGDAGVDAPGVPTCTLADGSVEPCPEQIAVDLAHAVDYAVPVAVNGSRWYAVRLRYRNAASPGGGLNVSLTFESGAAQALRQGTVALDAEHLVWTTETLLFQLSESELSAVDAVTLQLSSRLADGVTGFLDLDGIEVFDLSGGISLLPVEVGSFDAPDHAVTHPGDWAANAIDRLGGVAFFGSSSHHVSGGYAFSDEGRFYGAFFMGRTLGESLLLMAGGESGIVYGDPLYRPFAVRIHIPGEGGYGKAPGRTVGPADATLHVVQLEVLRGFDETGTTSWSLETCPTLDPAACAGTWTLRASGQGAVSGFPVDWTQFLGDPGVAQDVLLRLRVWNPGAESDALRHHAYFHWTP